MRVLFASDYAHIPENTGGLEINTHEICLALQAAGHQVAILAALVGRGMTGIIAKAKLRSGLASGWATDTNLGYPVLRSWTPEDHLGAVMDWYRPDAVVVQSWRFGMVEEVLRRGAGAVLYSHSAHSTIEGVSDRRLLARCALLANSAFNADFQGRALDAAFDVLYPLVNPRRYRCSVAGTHIVQIGLTTAKGAPLTLAIARRRPDIPFLIVKNWEGLQAKPEDAGLDQQAASLANLRVIRPKRDARELYRISRVLLVPSFCQEAWGRVVTEAQTNGIPVVASDRGGLPEAVGHGGVVLDPEAPLNVWVDAISRLWDDRGWHQEMSERALLRSQQDDIAAGPLFERFVAVLASAIARQTIPRAASPAGFE
jgi:glycosyltransferase involved in cell wall biosynthesis